MLARTEAYLAAMQVEGARWPAFRSDLVPLVVASPRWALLFGAPPVAGFVPLAGGRCPCWQPLGIDDLPLTPVLAEIRPRGARLDWRAPNVPLAEGALAACIVAASPQIPGVEVGEEFVHETFHLYQAIRFQGAASYVPGESTPLPRPAEERILLAEQLWLARALRRSGAGRAAALAAWSEVRKAEEKAGAVSTTSVSLELFEGSARYFELQTVARVRGLSRAAEESLLARALEQHGRDLQPDNWFYGEREYEVGAALCALLDDLWGDWSTRIAVDPPATLLKERVALASGATKFVPEPLEFAVPPIVGWGPDVPDAIPTLQITVEALPSAERPSYSLGWPAGAESASEVGEIRLRRPGLDIRLVGQIALTDPHGPRLRAFGPIARAAVDRLLPVGFDGPLDVATPQLQIKARRVRVERPQPGVIRLVVEGS